MNFHENQGRPRVPMVASDVNSGMPHYHGENNRAIGSGHRHDRLGRLVRGVQPRLHEDLLRGESPGSRARSTGRSWRLQLAAEEQVTPWQSPRRSTRRRGRSSGRGGTANTSPQAGGTGSALTARRALRRRGEPGASGGGELSDHRAGNLYTGTFRRSDRGCGHGDEGWAGGGEPLFKGAHDSLTGIAGRSMMKRAGVWTVRL